MVGMSLKSGVKWLWNTSLGYRVPILASVLVGTARIGVSLTFVWLCKYLIDIATHQTDGDIVTGLVLMTVCIILQLLMSSLLSRLYTHSEICLRNRLRHNGSPVKPCVYPKIIDSL